MGVANIGFKAFTDDFYHKICAEHLQPVLDMLRYIRHETGVWLELTTLLVAAANDSADELTAMCDWTVRELGTDRHRGPIGEIRPRKLVGDDGLEPPTYLV